MLTTVLDTGFSPWPCYTTEEIDAVAAVLASNRVNYWTGTQCRLFEREFSSWIGAKHAIAVANGSVALELALRAVGVGDGDEVIVSPRTFIASVSAIVNVGAFPVFADVDPDSQNITAEQARQVMSSRTRAIVCVHLAGWPCEMDAIQALAAERNLRLIEDCAQAHGARYRDHSVGKLGDVAAWSFCQDKIITTCGDGGMVTTEDRECWSKMWSYKEHGKSYEAAHGSGSESGFRWLHTTFGTNFRMTEPQAAVGRIQVARMPQWHRLRAQNAARLRDTALTVPALRVPTVPPHIEHAWYRFYVFVEPEKLRSNWNRDRIVSEIRARGVPCFSGTCPEVYLEKAFDDTGFRPKTRLPVARKLGETSLAFLVHPTLKADEVNQTCEALETVMKAAVV